MNAYDRHNVEEFNSYYDKGRYICSCCGRITTLSNSVSLRGYNLICMPCMYKLQSMLGLHEIIDMIQRVGAKRMSESEDKE